MPDLTMASAICRIMSSFTLQPNLFQLFQPMGGVLANDLSWAASSDGAISRLNIAIRTWTLADMFMSSLTLSPIRSIGARLSARTRTPGRLPHHQLGHDEDFAGPHRALRSDALE